MKGQWCGHASDFMLRRMDRELEALDKVRGHVDDIPKLAEMARVYMREGTFEDASVCLRLI